MITVVALTTTTLAFPVHGVVSDSDSRPLAYVNIGISQKGIGTVTDELGVFSLHVPNELRNDTLQFSMIGYETKKISLTLYDPYSPWVIQLTETSKVLEEIVVRSSGQKRIQLGRKTTGKFLISGLGTGDLGGEVGTRIAMKPDRVTLDSLHFFLVQNSFDTVKLRLNLYPEKGEFPKPSFVQKNIIVTIIGRKKGWISADLSGFNIACNEDFIACLELVDYSRKRKGAVYFSQAPPYTGPMYYRNKSMDRVMRYRGGPMGIYFTAYAIRE